MLIAIVLTLFTITNAKIIESLDNRVRPCIYAFTDPVYPSFILPPPQPDSPGDVQLNQNNSICFANGSSIAAGQGCNSGAFSYYDQSLDQFLTTYIDSNGENISIANIIYATHQDQLYVRTIQSNQANLEPFLAGKLLKIDLNCNNGLLGCAYFTVDGNSSTTLPPTTGGSVKSQFALPIWSLLLYITMLSCSTYNV